MYQQELKARTVKQEIIIWGVADKSLVRTGSKQTTVTNLGIIHRTPHDGQYTRCSNFCKPNKKKSKFFGPSRSPQQQWPPRRTKNGDLSIVFSVQRTGGISTGLDLENRVGDKNIESTGVRSFFWVASARWAGAFSWKNKGPFMKFPRHFSFKMTFSCTSRY